MRRLSLAFVLAIAITMLPWLLRPLFGDAIAILWLPGFVAISHWFPQGLHSPNAGAAKAIGCSANVIIWAAGLFAISYSIPKSQRG
jgi:amino acid permease